MFVGGTRTENRPSYTYTLVLQRNYLTYRGSCANSAQQRGSVIQRVRCQTRSYKGVHVSKRRNFNFEVALPAELTQDCGFLVPFIFAYLHQGVQSQMISAGRPGEYANRQIIARSCLNSVKLK